MILCLGTTPAAQRVMVFRKLTLDAVNRAAVTLDGVAGKSVNVAKVLQALGGEPVAVGLVGGDRGRSLEAALRQAGIAADFVTVAAPTRQCITVIDEAAGTITELVEEGSPVEPGECDGLLAILRRRMPGCGAVVMSGTIAKGCPVDLYARGVRLAREAGALSIVDAQGAPLTEALKDRPGLVKPNRLELEATVGRALEGEADLMAAMRELAERGAERVVVTAGAAPTLAFDGRRFWKVLAPSAAVVNPIGSGDAFTAGLVWRLVRGDDLGEACRWGSAAGTANALTLMPGELDPAAVERLAAEVVSRPL